MIAKFLVGFLLVWPCHLSGQFGKVRLFVNSAVDTSNHEIASVIRVWEAYLNSQPDSTYPNPFWSESEQRKYKPFDLAAHTWWSPSFYYFLPRLKTQVLSVSKTPDSFLIRTMFYVPNRTDSSQVSVTCILQTGARFENGQYKLCNVLPINTRPWRRENVGRITFVFPPEHSFDRSLAERMSRFVDSLANAWKLSVEPIEYYFAEDINRVAKVLGLDFYPAESSSKVGPRGFVDFRNRIIYSGGTGEWYPHEFVHVLINPLFPSINPYFSEGYATLVAGSGGQDLIWHIKRNYDYLKNHPGIDVLSFKGVDPYVGPQYFIGGLLCKMAEQKGGLPLIRKLMQYGPEENDLYRAVEDVFGIKRSDVNNFLRAKLAEFAEK